MHERAWLDRLLPRLGAASTAEELWAGDDGAVLVPPPGARVVAAVDPMVEGVHFDLALTGLDDAGWKAVARNVSDLAAMGAEPWRCLVSVIAPEGTALDVLYDGVLAAVDRWSMPVVGGDLAGGPAVVVSVTALGLLDSGRRMLRRSDARPGDRILVSGGLGRGRAGLRALRAGASDPWVSWYARPEPSVRAALAAVDAGATAGIDVSDGLSSDLDRLGAASGVGIALRSSQLPVAAGATGEDALHGGDEYVLAYTLASGGAAPAGHFEIGACTSDPNERTLDGERFEVAGWEHDV